MESTHSNSNAKPSTRWNDKLIGEQSVVLLQYRVDTLCGMIGGFLLTLQ